MAPTQILAEQHYLNFKDFSSPGNSHRPAHGRSQRGYRTAPAFRERAGLGSARVLVRQLPASSPETPVRRDAEQHTRDAYAPQTIRYAKRNLPHFERPWAKYLITFATRDRVALTRKS